MAGFWDGHFQFFVPSLIEGLQIDRQFIVGLTGPVGQVVAIAGSSPEKRLAVVEHVGVIGKKLLEYGLRGAEKERAVISAGDVDADAVKRPTGTRTEIAPLVRTSLQAELIVLLPGLWIREYLVGLTDGFELIACQFLLMLVLVGVPL